MSSSRAQSSKSSGSSSSPNEPSQASPVPELSSPAPTDMDQISAPALSSDAPTVQSDLSAPDPAASYADPSDASASLPDAEKTAAVKPLTPPKPPTRPVVAKSDKDPKPQSVKPSAVNPAAPSDKTADESSAAAKAIADAAAPERTEAKPGATDAGATEKNTPRNHPIPPASEPMQYRAIGLVRGVYAPSEDQFTRGTLTTEDGTVIDAVLLGRVMSLVKKHLDLTQAHLWVVYPRTREKATDLHAQIVGVWEPESLTKPKEDEPETDEASPETTSESVSEATSETAEIRMPDGLTDGYFSVRGEVLSVSPEQNRVVVRVQQSPKKTDKPGEDKERMFKIILHGTLEGKTVGYFWDLHAQRQGNNLTLQSGTLIGLVPPKKRKSKGGSPRNNFARKKRFPDRGGAPSRPVRAGEGGSALTPVRREGVSKPVKRKKDA